MASIFGRALPLAFLVSCGVTVSAGQDAPQVSRAMETVDQALCRMIEKSAATHGLAIEFFTRLIWRESSFRTGARSQAGAQGVAQFMPPTAAERGLADPFDPEQAIPKAAEFLGELLQKFGNLGLAAAAYNGGPGRVAAWLDGRGGLAAETRDYVSFITGRSVEDWAAEAKGSASNHGPIAATSGPRTCLQLAAGLRRPGPGSLGTATAFAPWGVQLAGNFSKALALASYARARQSFAAIIGETTPMIIGTRLLSRGTQVFYRVRVPAQTRTTANALCNRIHAAGGSCIVLHS